jgi:hypothetical protein
VTEVECSHVPMLSKPDVVIEVIRTAAAVMQKNKAAWRRVASFSRQTAGRRSVLCKANLAFRAASIDKSASH